MPTISSGEQPRERSLTGFAIPCRIGPYASAPPRRWVNLYAILPASMFGKIRTVELPARGLSGAFNRATDSTRAASPWSSPSMMVEQLEPYFSRSFCFANFVASTIRLVDELEAEPLVEYDNNATRGSMPKVCAVSALSIAISASSSAEGNSTIPQSEKINALSSNTIKKTLDIKETPILAFIICNAGVIVSFVEWVAPATNPSASPLCTNIVPKKRSFLISSRASPSVMPLCWRSSKYCCVYDSKEGDSIGLIIVTAEGGHPMACNFFVIISLSPKRTIFAIFWSIMDFVAAMILSSVPSGRTIVFISAHAFSLIELIKECLKDIFLAFCCNFLDNRDFFLLS